VCVCVCVCVCVEGCTKDSAAEFKLFVVGELESCQAGKQARQPSSVMTNAFSVFPSSLFHDVVLLLPHALPAQVQSTPHAQRTGAPDDGVGPGAVEPGLSVRRAKQASSQAPLPSSDDFFFRWIHHQAARKRSFCFPPSPTHAPSLSHLHLHRTQARARVLF